MHVVKSSITHASKLSMQSMEVNYTPCVLPSAPVGQVC